MKTEKIETVIIGGGQAGLSASYYLKRAKRDHIILERSTLPASAWTNHRWDSFTLVTPNWAFRIPGAEYQGSDPKGFMPRKEVAQRFSEYAAKNKLPLQYEIEVQSVTPTEKGFLIATNNKTYLAANTIVATGLYQKGKVPPFASGIPKDILQIVACDYRNPQALPKGAVLVVGSGQSGAQIAEELNESGRKVYLSVSSAGRSPRRYRGRDGYEWGVVTGSLDRTVDQLSSPAERFSGSYHVTGKNGGYNLNLHLFYRNGIVLLGHIRDIQDGKAGLKPDLKENLSKADRAESEFLKEIDATILQQGLPDPPEDYPVYTDGYSAPEILSLDLKSCGISTVIWACGFNFDYKIVKAAVFDEFGFPVTQRGKTQVPGLYFLGMPWLHTQKSGNLYGVGEDAKYVTDLILKRTKE